jgi:hypothetical protein
MNIEPYIQDIKDFKLLESPSYYNSTHWLHQFNDTPLEENVSYINNNYKTISRQDIIEYLASENSSLTTGFLLTMVWGHGFAENGRADNRGPWKVSKMFDDILFAEQILTNVRQHLINKNIRGAHLAFEKMKRCKVNFFSKFLYFLGRALGMTHYPLIFDRRVAQTIFNLAISDLFSKQILDVSPRQDAEAYFIYVQEIHRLGEHYQVDADKIEFFLYRGF